MPPPSPAPSNPPKSKEAVAWCKAARIKLKLGTGLLQKDKLKLDVKATSIAEGLDKLRGDIDAIALEDEFVAIAQRIDAQAGQEGVTQIEVEAERLNVLNKKLSLALAQKASDRSPGDKKLIAAAQKAELDLEKARTKLDKKNGEKKTLYQTRLLDSTNKLGLLRAIPYSVATTMQKQIADAEDKTKTRGDEDWAAAVDLLDEALAEYETAKTLAEKAKKEDTEHTQKRPLYESKQFKLGEVAKVLADLPGAGKYRDEVAKAIKAGEDAIRHKEPRPPYETLLYADGYAAIVALVKSTAKLEKEALTAAANAQKAIGKDSEINEAEKAARAALKPLRPSGAELVPEAVVDGFEREIAASVLMCADQDKKKFALERLAKAKRDAEALVLERTTIRERNKVALEQAQTLIASLLYAATEDERDALAEPMSRMQTARILNSALEFDDAEKILPQLIKDLTVLHGNSDHTREAIQQEWLKESTEPTGKLALAKKDVAALREALKTSALIEEERHAVAIIAIYEKQLLNIENQGKAGVWDGALKSLTGLRSDISKTLKLHSGTDPFAQRRKELAKPVDAAALLTRGALSRFQTVLEKQTDPGSAARMAEEALIQLENLWRVRRTTATDVQALDADGAQALFEAMTLKLEKQARDPVSLADAMHDGRYDAEKKQFAVVAKSVMDSLEELRAIEARTAAPHYRSHKEIVSAQEASTDQIKGPENPGTRMRALGVEVRAALEIQQRAVNTTRTTALEKATAAELALKGLLKAAESSLKRKERSFFEPFFDDLTQELKDLRAMTSSGSAGALQLAITELDAVTQRIQKMKTEVETQSKRVAKESSQELLDEAIYGEDAGDIARLFGDEELDTGPRPTPNFRIVMEAISSISKSLGDEALGRCMPVHKLTLAEEFKELQKAVNALSPEDGFTELQKFHVKLNARLMQARTASDLRARFNSEAFPAVQKRFSALGGIEVGTLLGKLAKFRKEPTAYLKELETRLLAAKAQVNEPQREQLALDNLEKIRLEIQEVIDNKDVLSPEKLIEQEKAAQARELQQAKEKKLWDALVVDFERMGMARAEAAVSNTPDSDDSQIKDLKRMLKQAKSTFKDSGSFLGAVEMLNACKLYATRVEQHPKGLKAASRDQLPKVKQHWKQSVAAFNDSVDTVVKNITDADDAIDTASLFGEDDPEAAKEAEKVRQAVARSIVLLNGLKGLFNANIMDGPIATLTNDRAKKAEQRQARELAMKYINDYRDVLRTDPIVVKMLDKNRPFGAVDFYGLNTALRDLDLNIQRAV